ATRAIAADRTKHGPKLERGRRQGPARRDRGNPCTIGSTRYASPAPCVSFVYGMDEHAWRSRSTGKMILIYGEGSCGRQTKSGDRKCEAASGLRAISDQTRGG